MKCKVIREFRRAVEGSVYGELLKVGAEPTFDDARAAESLAREGYLEIIDRGDAGSASDTDDEGAGGGDAGSASDTDDEGAGGGDDVGNGDGETGANDSANDGAGADDAAASPESAVAPQVAPTTAPKAPKASKTGGKK